MGRSSGSAVDLYWLPLGAGGRCVRLNGRVFEAAAARLSHREARDLYHSALVVLLHGVVYAIEMAPVWNNPAPDRGAVATGPVGLPWLGRWRAFRYEVRRWRGGNIPDVDEAVMSPHRVSDDPGRALRLLELLPAFPALTWGRDEQDAGEMWNSNSLVSWALLRSGHDLAGIRPPPGGRAPGWDAGVTVARRQLTPG
jgi:hypothetical protein